MSEQFERLRQLLSCGATSDECLFYECSDNTFLFFGTKFQTFKMPLDIDYIYKLALVYVQNGNIILKKTIDDFSVAEFDRSLIYFTLSEVDTRKFKKGKVEAQFKVLLEDGTILVSNILKINAVGVLDNSLFDYYNGVLETLQCNIREQENKLVQFKEIAAGSNKIHICRFIFDSTWDNFTKKAIFKDEYNNFIDNVNINKDNLCVIPVEVISAPGNIYIGVIGTYGEVEMPTEWSNSARVLNSCNYTEVAGKWPSGTDVPEATDEVAGIMKLYKKGGQNIDGTITQKAITDGFNSIKLKTDYKDRECLVLQVNFDQEK